MLPSKYVFSTSSIVRLLSCVGLTGRFTNCKCLVIANGHCCLQLTPETMGDLRKNYFK